MSELTTVPRSLEVDPDAWPSSPVETRIQELPISELRWENFERLCLRLARLEGTVETARLYGTPGQDQHGIDLYARTPLNPKYRVYQCKREQEFGAAKIRDAVADFVVGTWASRTETFVLCTQESLRNTQRSEAVEAQRAILHAKGIAFEVWDSEELNIRLKAHPVLVDDFFGRVWTKAFCSPDQQTQLDERLDGPSAAKLRGELRSLYTNIFRLADPGFPSDSDSQRLLALYDRYVIPDILEDRIIHSSVQSPEPTIGEDGSPTGTTRSNGGVKQNTFQLRRSVDNWLTENPHSIVLGGPGMGKSALLRFIALDILSPTPRCLPLGTANATRLPIWVPFAYWPATISSDKAAAKSLADILVQLASPTESRRHRRLNSGRSTR